MADASARTPRDRIGSCLRPTHFHRGLRPHAEGDLSRGRHWLVTAHARRDHHHDRTTGHVGQGRFQAFPIEADAPLRTVLRSVARNPWRAEWVGRADDGRSSSLGAWWSGAGPLWAWRAGAA